MSIRWRCSASAAVASAGVTAAGRFAQQFEQVMLLRASVGTAAPQATGPRAWCRGTGGRGPEALAADPELLAEERSRIRLLLVDDVQHLDPQAMRLVRAVAAGTELTVLAGDPNCDGLRFRGADPNSCFAVDSPGLHLTRSYCCARCGALSEAWRRGCPELPPGADLTAQRRDEGSVSVRVAGSVQAEAALIADTLRRAHLIDGVPWSELAVIVRSVKVRLHFRGCWPEPVYRLARPAVDGPIAMTHR